MTRDPLWSGYAVLCEFDGRQSVRTLETLFREDPAKCEQQLRELVETTGCELTREALALVIARRAGRQRQLLDVSAIQQALDEDPVSGIRRKVLS